MDVSMMELQPGTDVEVTSSKVYMVVSVGITEIEYPDIMLSSKKKLEPSEYPTLYVSEPDSKKLIRAESPLQI